MHKRPKTGKLLDILPLGNNKIQNATGLSEIYELVKMSNNRAPILQIRHALIQLANLCQLAGCVLTFLPESDPCGNRHGPTEARRFRLAITITPQETNEPLHFRIQANNGIDFLISLLEFLDIHFVQPTIPGTATFILNPLSPALPVIPEEIANQ